MQCGNVFLGSLPNGKVVYCSPSLVAQIGYEQARYDLVDSVWIAECGHAPGYYPVRTSPFRDDHIMVKADSHKDAVDKYLRSLASE